MTLLSCAVSRFVISSTPCWLVNLFVVLYRTGLKSYQCFSQRSLFGSQYYSCIGILTMLFSTLIVRSPIFPVMPLATVVKQITFSTTSGHFTIATKWRPLLVSPLLEFYLCLKHFARYRLRTCIYLENKMGLTYWYEFKYIHVNCEFKWEILDLRTCVYLACVYHFHNKNN